MTSEEKNKIEEEDLIEEMQEEIEEIENEEGEIDEEKLENSINPKDDEVGNEKQDETCMDKLARTMADFENFKKRTERDRQNMIFYLKWDIFKKILPRLDDVERIIKNTPENIQSWALFEWILSIEKKLKKDLENLWVKSFDSIWKEVNPDKHDVMTTVPWKTEWIIFDEFEKWYVLWDKVLRHAKVVVWVWE